MSKSSLASALLSPLLLLNKSNHAQAMVNPNAPNGTIAPCPAPCPISVGTRCVNTLKDAVATAQSGEIVFINGDVQVGVDSELVLTQEMISFVGCGTQRPVVYTQVNNPQGAIFRVPAAREQMVSFAHIDFERRSTDFASVLRTPELGDVEDPIEVTYAATHLSVDACSFKNFRTQARGGGAIFLGRSGDISIRRSDFSGNRATKFPDGRLRWDSGGGAIYVREVMGNVDIDQTTFSNNQHEFEHGNGGALAMDYISDESRVLFGSQTVFANNRAPAGGAVYIGLIEGGFNTYAEFINNMNVPGWGTRGGAIWLQNSDGATVEIGGKFHRNMAMIDSSADGNGLGRGGAIATNQIKGSTIVITGEFLDNQSLGGGAVLDGFSNGGSLRDSRLVFNNAVLRGNQGKGTDLAVKIQNADSGNIAISESQVNGQVVTLM